MDRRLRRPRTGEEVEVAPLVGLQDIVEKEPPVPAAIFWLAGRQLCGPAFEIAGDTLLLTSKRSVEGLDVNEAREAILRLSDAIDALHGMGADAIIQVGATLPMGQTAATAERWGLVSRIVPRTELLAEAKRLAATIASRAPIAAETAKLKSPALTK